MKKYIIIAVVIALMFVPIPLGSLDDGGTREYRAVTYRLVKWNKLVAETAEIDGIYAAGHVGVYKRTAVYGFGDMSKSLSELYELERARDDYREHINREG